MITCLLLHLVFYGVLGLGVYTDFHVLKENARLFAHASRLSNLCSAIKRHEEEFITRRNDNSLDMAEEYTEKAINYLNVILSDIKNRQAPLDYLPEMLTDPAPGTFNLPRLEKTMKQYQAVLAKIAAQGMKCRGDDGENLCIGAEDISDTIMAMSEKLLSSFQNRMDEFVEHFKVKLVIYIGMLLLFILATALVMYRTVLTPLRTIEEAAHSIATGSFTSLPVPGHADEVQSVIRAFNTMVENLEKNQEQLFQAKKLSSVGTLASGTAHQLNNPLNNISTSCQIALEELKQGDCEFIERMLKIIEQESYRAGEIVKGLLEFSRVQTFSMSPCSLEKIIHRVFSLAQNEKKPGIKLEKNLPEGDIILNVDRHKITEALLNLVINGIQAINGEKGHVTISARADRGNQTGIITVSDSGKGVAKEDIHKIFDPFFTTKKAGKGTGLGLAVVYGIIRKHRGTIRVNSPGDSGAEFIITLPLAEPSDAKAENGE